MTTIEERTAEIMAGIKVYSDGVVDWEDAERLARRIAELEAFLAEQDFDYNRKTNQIIERHAGQVSGLLKRLEAADRMAATPATLEEALRDYAMFGKFVAKAPEMFAPEQLAGFVGDWLRKTHPDEYVAFVKEEMGK